MDLEDYTLGEYLALDHYSLGDYFAIDNASDIKHEDKNEAASTQEDQQKSNPKTPE